MGALTAPYVLSAPTPACAASVSTDRFRFNAAPLRPLDEIHDVAPLPFRRFLLLPRQVGEGPAVENRFDRFGGLLDQAGHRGGNVLRFRFPPLLSRAGGRHRPLD